MAPVSGTAGSVVIVAGGTVVVGGMSEWSASFTMDPVETTDFGANWMRYIPSVRGVTGNFQGNWDRNDAAQGTVIAYYMAGSALTLRLYAGTSYYSGSALITGMEPAISQKGKGDVAFAFTGTDTWTLT